MASYAWISDAKLLTYTFWLLVVHDFDAFLVPEIVEGVLGALSGPLLFTNGYPSPSEVLLKLPHVVIWVTLHLLIFNLSNQRLPGSVNEDKINNPYRPIPSGRITPQQADKLLLTLIGVQFILSQFWLGGKEEILICYSMNWMYNDIGVANDNFVIRNLILGLGLPVLGKGATSVILKGSPYAFNQNAWLWYILNGAVICTTLHTQDLRDVSGDFARGRKTAPIVLGDANTRFGLMVTIIFWSAFCPMFWQTQKYVTVAILLFGALVASRIMLLRTSTADRQTYRVYAMWLMSIKIMPWLAWMTYGLKQDKTELSKVVPEGGLKKLYTTIFNATGVYT